MVQRLLSWRIAIGVGVGAVLVATGVDPVIAVVAGVLLWVGSSVVESPTAGRARRRIDPFTVGEPWRQFVQAALRSADRAHTTVDSVAEGPLRTRLESIVGRLDHGVQETWRIARRGDEIDEAVQRLDPTALRAKLAVLHQQQSSAPSEQLETAIDSVESQLATTDRLKDRSARAVNTLRLAQTRMDELVTRTAEIAVGAGDTDAYEHDVDDLVIELEALRQAIREV